MLHGKKHFLIRFLVLAHYDKALDENSDELRGVVVCKLENHRSGTYRGYIAMLATVEEFRGKGIATKLVKLAIEAMKSRDADEVSIIFLLCN
jgi:ribosomal protein S18 acetylase RimI-like enzyme